MEAPEGSPLNRAGSEDVLVENNGAGRPTRSSNGRAVMIAAVTTLVCVLVSAQVFTAYMVLEQRQQIQRLQMNQQRLQAQMARAPSQKLVMPFSSFPVLDLFDALSDETPTPETKIRPSVEEELQEVMQDVSLPHFNQSVLDNLQDLREKLNETSWRDFKAWLRYWLLLQTAQKTPTPQQATPAPRTKCQVDASAGVADGLLGSFRPQCDDEGQYRSRQCWPSTGECWCVDESGARISHISRARGHLDCDKVRSSRTSSDAAMMPLLFHHNKQEKKN